MKRKCIILTHFIYKHIKSTIERLLLIFAKPDDDVKVSYPLRPNSDFSSVLLGE